MQFLNPALLFGLLAAGIPILLHFLSRRQVVEVPFAPLRFLQPTQERQMRRVNLRRLLLLLLRILIVVCVVLAAARPTLTGALAGLAGGGDGTSVVVLLDNSASMQAEVSEGTLFDRARDEAVEIARTTEGDDEVAVLLYSDVTRPLFSEFVRDPGLIEAELDEVAPGARATDYVTALEQALEFLERADRPRREIYLVGDFQIADVDSTVRARWLRTAREIQDTAVFLRPVEAEPFVNRTVDPVPPQSVLLRQGETIDVRARVSQDGGETVETPLFLELEGTTVGETGVVVPPEGSARHRFPLTLPEAGDAGGSVRLRPDRYALDDESFFVLTVSDQVPVRVLRGVTGEEGARDPLLFLLTALDPERAGQGRFAPTVELAGRFDVETLPEAPVVLGVDLRDLGAARLSALGDYLRRGGTMLLFAGDPRVRTYTNQRLLSGWTNLRLGPFRGEEDVFERLEVSAPDHPVFADLEPEARATLEEVRLRNFFRMDETVGRPLLRYAGGGAAATEIEVGEGRVIVCAFETSAVSGEIAFSPMFLPLVQRMTGYLATAGWGRFDRHFAVGESPVIEVADVSDASARWTVVGPDRDRVPAELDASTRPARLHGPEAEMPGLYRFEKDGRSLGTVAVNVSRSESRRQWWEPDGFAELFEPDTGLRFAVLEGAATEEAVRAARRGQPIHHWFLIAAGLLLVAEGLLARRLGPAPAA